jgi:hypothetical protein
LKTTPFYIFFITTFSLFAQQIPINNPKIFPPKEKYHSNVIPFDDLDAALEGKPKKSPYYLPLTDGWKTIFHETLKDTSDGFCKNNFIDTLWKETNLIRDQTVSKQVLNPGNRIKISRKAIEIPEKWKGREVFLYFEASTSAFYLWVNGRLVGFYDNLLHAAEFDITRFLKEKNNRVTVCFLENSVGKALLKNRQILPFKVFGDVYLYATPKLQICDFQVETSLDNSYKNATLKIKGEVRNLDKKDLYKYSIEFALYDARKKLVFNEKSPLFSFARTKSKTKGINYEKFLASVQVWNSENPYLYTLIITMRSDKDKVMEILTDRIGFKSIENKNNSIQFNGKKTRIKAIQFSDSLLLQSQYSEEDIRKLILNIKRKNANAIACQNATFTSKWLDVCDELGVYVCQDAGFTADSILSVQNDSLYFNALKDKIGAQASTYKNHVSLFLYSIDLGNSYFPTNDSLIALLKRIDTQHLIYVKSAVKYLSSDLIPFDSTQKNILFRIKPKLLLNSDFLPSVLPSFNIERTNFYTIYGGFWDYHFPEQQLKEILEPFSLLFSDSLCDKLQVYNESESLHLANYTIHWELQNETKVLQNGNLKLDLNPGEVKTISVPFKQTFHQPNAKLAFKYSIQINNANFWANKNQVVAHKKLVFRPKKSEK